MPLDQSHQTCCTIDVALPLFADHLPVQHAASYYAALCALPDFGAWLAEAEDIAIAPITGDPESGGPLAPALSSNLLLRLPATELPRVLRLAGRSLLVDGQAVDIGEPKIELTRPAATLHARLVVFDGGIAAEDVFLGEVRRQLAELEIAARWELGEAGALPLADRALTGFALRVTDLTADDGIHLQEAGLGAHRKLGCGVFLAD